MQPFTPQEIKEFIGSIRSADKQHSAVYLMIADDIITYLQQREKTFREALIPLTDAYLNAMQARCDAATRQPWIFYADLPSTEPNWHIVTNESRMRVIANVYIEPGNEMDIANATFIAAARTDMPRLIATARSLRTALNGDN